MIKIISTIMLMLFMNVSYAVTSSAIYKEVIVSCTPIGQTTASTRSYLVYQDLTYYYLSDDPFRNSLLQSNTVILAAKSECVLLYTGLAITKSYPSGVIQ